MTMIICVEYPYNADPSPIKLIARRPGFSPPPHLPTSSPPKRARLRRIPKPPRRRNMPRRRNIPKTRIPCYHPLPPPEKPKPHPLGVISVLIT